MTAEDGCRWRPGQREEKGEPEAGEDAETAEDRELVKITEAVRGAKGAGAGRHNGSRFPGVRGRGQFSQLRNYHHEKVAVPDSQNRASPNSVKEIAQRMFICFLFIWKRFQHVSLVDLKLAL